ncbi:fatty acid hydroxylase [Mycena floridula]|nr:fatty acid hydroxylase [Mycena floridula]
MSTPIPEPPGLPFLGHANSLDNDTPLLSYVLLAKKYGEIFALNIAGHHVTSVNSYELVNEVSDEKRFKKPIAGNLLQVRNLVGDGLFTARQEEPNWKLAHRLLMPAFGTIPTMGMLEDMRDICDQLLLKWERFGPSHVIDPAEDFTRLAFDTVAFCSMSYRVNSFYSQRPQPFVSAMGDFLKECFARTKRPSLVQALMPGATNKYAEDQKVMHNLVDQIIAERKANPVDKNDLLNTMLYQKDKETGQGLSDKSISNNLLTFLIAGHETTSGTLSFIIYLLLHNPETMRKLRAEVDTVIGSRPLQKEDLNKLPYLTAVMRESMRLCPPVPMRSTSAIEDTTLAGGKYAVKAGATIIVQNYIAQRDPKVWGDDAEEFRPERMLDGKFEALPPNAWQPFGFGSLRSCIGRPFAWQEITLVMVSIMQKFDLELANPSYKLEFNQTLTIKPKQLGIRARLRKDKPLLTTAPSAGLVTTEAGASQVTSAPSISSKIPLYVLYGSNTGTSETLAQRFVQEAGAHGFLPKIGTLNSMTNFLPTDGPIVIVTASFEGQPADNAGQFVDWLTSLKGNELKGTRFAVFGCGNSDWVQTYQRIPKLCNELLEKHGGARLLPFVGGDVSQGNFFGLFDKFEADLWTTLAKEYAVKASSSEADTGFQVTSVDSGTERSSKLRQDDAGLGTVVENKVLTAPGHPTKIHIEFQLPEGQTYRAGDYLAILPRNPVRDIRRVLSFFALEEDHHVIVSSVGPTSLPVGQPVTLFEILRGYVELSQPATARDIGILLDATTDDSVRSALENLKSNYEPEVLAKRLSVLDILEKYPTGIKVTLTTFLRMMPSMRVRQYSISSSPLWNPENVTLTISVLEAPALSGNDKVFLGVASTYMAHLRPGDRVQMTVRSSAAAFHPPQDPTIPLVMFCAGSGFAPMRGFIQERALQKTSGREVGPILLFFGCRLPKVDYLYGDAELKEWVELGLLDVRPAFSQNLDASEGCKYVQDRLWHDKQDVRKAYRDGARFFTCGSGTMAKGVRAKMVDIVKDLSESEIDRETAEASLDKMIKGRYATDIFD